MSAFYSGEKAAAAAVFNAVTNGNGMRTLENRSICFSFRVSLCFVFVQFLGFMANNVLKQSKMKIVLHFHVRDIKSSRYT